MYVFDTKSISPDIMDSWKRNVEIYSQKLGTEFKKDAICFVEKDKEKSGIEKYKTICARMAFIDRESAGYGSYIILHTFYENGIWSLLDVVEHPGDNEDMFKDYINNVLTHDVFTLSFFENMGLSRFIKLKGLMKSDSDRAYFYGSDFNASEKVSIYGAHDIASYVSFMSDLFENVENDMEDIVLGSEYVGKCLETMFKHGGSPDFYRKLMDLYFREDIMSGNAKISEDIFNSIVWMKTLDRIIKESFDMTYILKTFEKEWDSLRKPVKRMMFEKMSGKN